jgi:phosphatidate cytidylyltransferase
MLKTRMLTASILIPLVILGILFLPNHAFAIVSGIVFLQALWEWTQLAGFKSIKGRAFCFVLVPFVSLVLLAILRWFGNEILREAMPLLIVLFWCLASIILIRYPKDEPLLKWRTFGIIAGCLVLMPSWGLLFALQRVDPTLVLYVMALVWVSDIAAYFAGRRFGKHKLIPLVSPGKTWEGVFGALLGSIIVIIVGYWLITPNMSKFHWIMIGLITVTASIVGDLFESVFKRIRHLKDSGKILPGHGGVLDRIDSLTAAIPIFSIGFMFFS